MSDAGSPAAASNGAAHPRIASGTSCSRRRSKIAHAACFGKSPWDDPLGGGADAALSATILRSARFSVFCPGGRYLPRLSNADKMISRRESPGYRFCAGFWTPAITKDPRAQLAGVQKAPRHEVAGSWALACSELCGFDVGAVRGFW